MGRRSSMSLIKRPITYTFPFRLLLPLRCCSLPASYRFLTQSLSPRRFPQPIVLESLSDPFSLATPNHSSYPYPKRGGLLLYIHVVCIYGNPLLTATTITAPPSSPI